MFSQKKKRKRDENEDNIMIDITDEKESRVEEKDRETKENSPLRKVSSNFTETFASVNLKFYYVYVNQHVSGLPMFFPSHLHVQKIFL